MAFTLTSDVANASVFDSTTGTSIAVTLPTVATGDFIYFWMCFDNDPTIVTVSVSDTNGAYTAGASVYNSADNQGNQHFFRKNSASATNLVITASWTGNEMFRGAYAAAWSGCDTVTGLDGTQESGADNNQPGTATDAISSGSVTPSTTDLILGACQENGIGATTVAAGTNFSTNTDDGNQTATLNARFTNRTTASAGAATFTDTTNGTSGHYTALVMAVKPLAGGGPAAAPMFRGS